MDLHDTYIRHRNAEASSDLLLGVAFDAESDREYVFKQLERNLRLDVPWLIELEPNDRPSIVCGAAPSLRDYLGEIKEEQNNGAVIYACNTAAQVLASSGITPDYQVVLDPNRITLDEHEPTARHHLLASIAHPRLFKVAKSPILWHPCTQMVVDKVDEVDREFTYIGGGITVTNSAVCIAYTLGHRKIDVYGMDSSYQTSYYADGRSLEDISSHQLRVVVDAFGKKYSTTYDLKQQVVVFLNLAKELQLAGVKIDVHGNGLLPDVWSNLSYTGETK